MAREINSNCKVCDDWQRLRFGGMMEILFFIPP